MKKKILAAILAGAMLAGLAGCSSGAGDAQSTESDSSSEESAEASSDSCKIGVLMKTMSDTYSNKLGEAIESYAEQVLDLAADANIPVIEINTETTRTDYVSYIGSDDTQAGEIMGNFVMEQLGEEGGQYAILEGEMGQSAQLLRYEGLENTILADDTYECVATLSANWSRDEAMSTTEDWLGKYPELKAIICENDDMAMGALQAAESQNRDLIIIGTDAIPDALQAVKDGRLSGTVLQDANSQASTAVDTAVKVASGEEVEERYDISFQLITIDNVDQYIEE